MKLIDLKENKLTEVKDLILITEIKKNSRSAFNVLYDKYIHRLVNALLKNNSFIKRDEAEDYAIEAFMDFYENIRAGKYNEKGSTFNYLYTIAHRKYLRVIEKQKEFLDDDRITMLENKVYENDTEKEIFVGIAEEVINKMTIGRDDKKINCAELIYAQYGAIKVNDEYFFNEFPGKFTNVDDVRKKRNKCMQKIREEALKLLGKRTLIN